MGAGAGAPGQPLSLGQQQGALGCGGAGEGDQGSRWFFVWSRNEGEGPLPDPSPFTPSLGRALDGPPGEGLSSPHPRLMQETLPVVLTRGGAGKGECFQDSGLLLNTPYLEPPPPRPNPHQPIQDEGHREPGRARLVSPCCRRGRGPGRAGDPHPAAAAATWSPQASFPV